MKTVKGTVSREILPFSIKTTLPGAVMNRLTQFREVIRKIRVRKLLNTQTLWQHVLQLSAESSWALSVDRHESSSALSVTTHNHTEHWLGKARSQAKHCSGKIKQEYLMTLSVPRVRGTLKWSTMGLKCAHLAFSMACCAALVAGPSSSSCDVTKSSNLDSSAPVLKSSAMAWKNTDTFFVNNTKHIFSN